MLIKFKTYILTLKYINNVWTENILKILIYLNLIYIIFIW